MEKYKSRDISFTGIKSVNDWQIKTYSITYDIKYFSKEAEAESIKLLESELPEIGENNYGLGFMIIHYGKEINYTLIDWWCNKNELQHQVYLSSKEKPKGFRKLNRSTPIACVWELLIINHERDAWVNYMMTENPNQMNYLKSPGIFNFQ